MENDSIFAGGMKSKLLIAAVAIVGVVIVLKLFVEKKGGGTGAAATPPTTGGTTGLSTPTRNSDVTLTLLAPGMIPTQGDTVIATPATSNNTSGQPMHFNGPTGLPASFGGNAGWGPPAPYVGPAGHNVLPGGYAAAPFYTRASLN